MIDGGNRKAAQVHYVWIMGHTTLLGRGDVNDDTLHWVMMDEHRAAGP